MHVRMRVHFENSSTRTWAAAAAAVRALELRRRLARHGGCTGRYRSRCQGLGTAASSSS